ELVQCNTCKRSFNPKVLMRHSAVCQKSLSKKRRVFDSSRQRAEGTDISTLKPVKPKDGGPLPPPPPPTYDPDYVQCPYCQRRFNQHAAERHIKFCQEQAARMPQKGKLAEVKKPPARAQVSRVKRSCFFNFRRTNWSRRTFTQQSRPRAAYGDNAPENDIGNGGVKSKFCHGCGSKFVCKNNGVLFENQLLQIGIKSEYRQNLDYVQCPYCQRRFNQHAAERHIKFCQEQAARMPQKGKLAEAKKPPARTQMYRLTLRCSKDSVSKRLCELLAEQF
ncbi:unnamed protein product, partial [Tetraodon nigroviridis]